MAAQAVETAGIDAPLLLGGGFLPYEVFGKLPQFLGDFGQSLRPCTPFGLILIPHLLREQFPDFCNHG
jgi:hypothetical protein